MLDPVCLEPLHRRRLAVVNQYSVLHRKQHRLKVHLEEPDRHQHTLYLVAAHNPYNRLVVQRYLVQNRIKAQVRIEKTRNESIPLGCVPPAFVALGGRIPYGGCPTPDTLSPLPTHLASLEGIWDQRNPILPEGTLGLVITHPPVNRHTPFKTLTSRHFVGGR